jgi:hypothetical protein
MNFSKLRKIHIIIIGSLVCVILGGGLYYALITKATKSLEDETARYNQYAATGTQNNVALQQAGYQQALQDAASAENKLNYYFARQMPYLDFRDRKSGMIALWQEQSLNLGPLLISYLKTSGVQLDPQTQITIPAPPSNPNDLSSDQLAPITIPLGKIRVRGSFSQIMAHIRKWNTCKRLVMIDNPQITGISPDLTCEYDATVYIFPRYAATSAQIAMAGGGGSTSGTGMLGGIPTAGPSPTPGAGAGGTTPPPSALPPGTGGGTR